MHHIQREEMLSGVWMGNLWPDLIDVLFLGSFSDLFQRVKRKKGTKLHENAKCLEILYFFPDFFLLIYRRIQETTHQLGVA